MSVGMKLRALRGKKTQQKVAQDLGISKSAWAMYEKNERVPRDEVKIRIAKYFNESVGSIFYSD